MHCVQWIIIVHVFLLGFTDLHASHEFACIRETVTYSCATSHQFMIWKVTFTERTIGSKVQLFRRSDSPKSLFKFVYGQRLHFQLISTANGTIQSTFVVQASLLMENATTQCEGSVIHHLIFRRACKVSHAVDNPCLNYIMYYIILSV